MTPDCSFRIPASHPSLPGHFPGRPVVPGVVLLDLLIEATTRACPGRRVVGLPAVKFLRPVRPEQDVAVHLQPAGDWVAVSCTVNGQEVLRGTLALAPL
jgi:3-hydroxymyristoyl/3-hydroxydecanoyl-(acyl carrier protein) dehydratase